MVNVSPLAYDPVFRRKYSPGIPSPIVTILTRQMDRWTACGSHLRLLGGISSLTTHTLVLPHCDGNQNRVAYTSGSAHV